MTHRTHHAFVLDERSPTMVNDHPRRTVNAPLGPGYRRCPVCGSYEIEREVEFGRVRFRCRRCGIVFTD